MELDQKICPSPRKQHPKGPSSFNGSSTTWCFWARPPRHSFTLEWRSPKIPKFLKIPIKIHALMIITNGYKWLRYVVFWIWGSLHANKQDYKRLSLVSINSFNPIFFMLWNRVLHVFLVRLLKKLQFQLLMEKKLLHDSRDSNKKKPVNRGISDMPGFGP